MARVIATMLATTAALLLAGGCGGDDGSATAETPPTATTSAVADVILSIDEGPRRGVKARAVGRRLVVRTTVSGHAQPFGVLRVVSACGRRTCTTGATADGDGRWRTSVLLSASLRKPYARVTAELSGESAVALVRLRAPRAAQLQRGGAKASAGGASAPEPEGDAPAREGSGASSSLPGSGDGAPTTGGAGPGAIPAPVDGTPELVLIGDSLAEGIAALLPGQLPGWRVTTDGETGRTLKVGLQRWSLARAASTPTVTAFSLFTNDDPRNVAALEAAVRQTAEAQAGGCVVWATIARPPVGGVTYAAANAALARVAAAYPGRVALVPWAQAVRANPQWLRADGVHATPDGYAARAQLYAEAARGCAGL